MIVNRPPPIVLSIAGYDPSSGAGITADVKTAAAQGCYAVTCTTALTVQSTQGVFTICTLDCDTVAQTLRALAADVEIAAVKVGMLGSGAVAETVADFLQAGRCQNVVLDPVIRSSSGATLLDESGLTVLRKRLLPLCDVVTPNIEEAAELAGTQAVKADALWEQALPELRATAKALHGLGARGLVITGGHLSPANDYLSYMTGGFVAEEVVLGHHIDSPSTHGTGCAFSTALACQLALGRELPAAVAAAKDYVRRAILGAYPLGKGTGPINHNI